jgi:hypothetical protein
MKGLTLSSREQTKLTIMNMILDRRYPVKEAARLIGISERHTWRLLAAYRREGAAALALYFENQFKGFGSVFRTVPPTMSEFQEELSLRDLLFLLVGGEWRKRLENHTKPNDQLFAEYLDIVKASKSYKWYRETQRLLDQFHEFVGQFPPTLELFTRFFQRYTAPDIRLSTRARYYYVFSAFFKWFDGSTPPLQGQVPQAGATEGLGRRGGEAQGGHNEPQNAQAPHRARHPHHRAVLPCRPAAG